MANAFTHQPVMLAECLAWLDLRADAVVVDGTVGGGGHAAAILERIGPAGRLIGLDRDREALAAAGERLASFGDRVELVHASFRRLDEILAAARDVCDPSVEGLFISCTAVRAAETVDAIEDALGKPVVTSNQAMFWQAIRVAGCDLPVTGYGRLLH